MKSSDQVSEPASTSRVLLLVDDEKNILAALKRLLHQEGYRILTANGGQEALETLASTAVDVIVSDQRMPGMTGVEFFRTAKVAYPDTIRIMLSGYIELQSVTDAVNEGSIYKFLTKPWDDVQLKEHIAEAFRRKELANENLRLNEQLRVANAALEKINAQLDEVLQQKDVQIKTDETMLDVAHEVLQYLPLGVIGLDEENLIVLANTAAEHLFSEGDSILGEEISRFLPMLWTHLKQDCDTAIQYCLVELNDVSFEATLYPMGHHSQSRGRLLTLVKKT